MEVEPNQAIMPINVAPSFRLKNVRIGYKDGGFSYLRHLAAKPVDAMFGPA
jgi:hypothetical protein